MFFLFAREGLKSRESTDNLVQKGFPCCVKGWAVEKEMYFIADFIRVAKFTKALIAINLYMSASFNF